MTPQPNELWKLSGALFELLEAREEAAQNVQRAIVGPGGVSSNDAGELSPLQIAEEELDAIETGIQQFVAAQLREVDGLRAPLKALEQGVSINKADAAESTNRAMVLQNKYDRLKDLIKQCMVALDEAGEWKPKESRKFESARGSFSLRGNGGAQPVEITDEALVPDEYTRKTITLSPLLLQDILNVLPDSLIKRLANEAKESKREVSKSAIAVVLSTNCERCDGNGIVEAWGELDEDADYRAAENPCEECGGSGKRGVPGCRLADRGVSLVVK